MILQFYDKEAYMVFKYTWQKSNWGKGGGHDDNELDIVMVLKMCMYMESFLILINRRMYGKLIDTIVNTPMHEYEYE